jgi:hypothetical protein
VSIPHSKKSYLIDMQNMNQLLYPKIAGNYIIVYPLFSADYNLTYVTDSIIIPRLDGRTYSIHMSLFRSLILDDRAY